MRKKLEKPERPQEGWESFDLAQSLADAAVAGVGESGLRLELDIPQALCFPADPTSLVQLVYSLVGSAASNLEEDGEITVTAWEAGEALEIEVADNGPAIQSRPRFIPLAVARLGAELVWQNCPQGGAAVTVVVPRVAPKRSVA